MCRCTEPAEIAVVRGQAVGSGQPLGHRSDEKVQLAPATDLSLLLWHQPASQGKRRGAHLPCSHSALNTRLTSQATRPAPRARRLQSEGFEPYLQVVTHLLAVRQALDLRGGAEIQSLPFISETKGPRYPHVCHGQIVDVQQRAKAGQAEEKQVPGLVTSCRTRLLCGCVLNHRFSCS